MQKQTAYEKVQELLNYFKGIDIQPGEAVQLDQCTYIVDVQKFINFSNDLLKGKTNFTKITRPYILRLHKLRLYYEQKRKNTTG